MDDMLLYCFVPLPDSRQVMSYLNIMGEEEGDFHQSRQTGMDDGEVKIEENV
jgi:hypothetical protein